MEQGFPPDASWREVHPGTIALHVVMLSLGIAAVWGVFRTARRPVTKADAWMWTIGCLISAFSFIWAVDASQHFKISETSAPFVLGYIVFVGFVCALGTMVSHVRLHRDQRASHAATVFFCLIGLGLLVLALLPHVPMAREAARRSQCKNNMKQIALALFKFEDQHKHLPKAAEGNPPVSWRVAALPFMEGHKLFDQYDKSASWDDSKNEPVARYQFSSLMCPSRRFPDRDSRERFFTDYLMLSGPGTMSPGDRSVRVRDFTDGEANTAMIVEATGQNVVWTEPRDFDTSRQPIGVNLKGKEPLESPGLMSSYHRGGGHLLTGDGSVRFISEKMDPRILKKLSTIDGGERIDEDY